jgi:hypothetical protein
VAENEALLREAQALREQLSSMKASPGKKIMADSR